MGGVKCYPDLLLREMDRKTWDWDLNSDSLDKDMNQWLPNSSASTVVADFLKAVAYMLDISLSLRKVN